MKTYNLYFYFLTTLLLLTLLVETIYIMYFTKIEKTINMIKDLYANSFCRPLINNIKLLGFGVRSGVPRGCSLSSVLFQVTMIPLLAKINCFPLHTIVRLYHLYYQKNLNPEVITSYNI